MSSASAGVARAAAWSRPRWREACRACIARVLAGYARLFAAISSTSSSDDDETSVPSDHHDEASLGAPVDAEVERLFDMLYTEHLSKVTAYCWRLTGNRELAEDLAHDTFVSIWRRVDVLLTRSEPVWWLFQVASRVCIDYLRRRRTGERVVRLWLPLQRRHDDSLERRVEAHDLITWAILQLPPDLRQTWVLRELQGFTYQEIAQILSQDEGTIRKRLYRARKRLKAWVGDDGATREEGQGERS